MDSRKFLATRAGQIVFPAFIPVTTFGDRYPIDLLIQPYLPRFAQAIMVSRYYSEDLNNDNRPSLPIMIDSGGFACLLPNAKVKEENGLGSIEIETDDKTECITPSNVLDLQESKADVAFTLDFPISPNAPKREAARRRELTINNAIWALENRRRRDLPLYACVQGTSFQRILSCAEKLSDFPFDGFAIGGLVPRARDKEFLSDVVSQVRSVIGERPLHVFGLGQPDTIRLVFESGADSVDSSSYVRMAADGKLLGEGRISSNLSTAERLNVALCNLAQATGTALPLQIAVQTAATYPLTTDSPP